MEENHQHDKYPQFGSSNDALTSVLIRKNERKRKKTNKTNSHRKLKKNIKN